MTRTIWIVVTPRGTQAILSLLGTLSNSPYTRKPSVKPCTQPKHVASRWTRTASLVPSLSTLEQTSRKSRPDRLMSGCSGALFWPLLAGTQTKKIPSSVGTRIRRTLASLFHLFNHSNLLQRLQILHYHLQRNRPILRRHRIANLLRIPLSICKIQNLIRVLFSAAPQSLITQQLRRRHSRHLPVIRKIVIPEHRERAPRFLEATKNSLTSTSGFFSQTIWKSNQIVDCLSPIRPQCPPQSGRESIDRAQYSVLISNGIVWENVHVVRGGVPTSLH